LLQGWLWRQRDHESRRKRAETVAAYFVAHLLNVSGKTIKGKVSVKDLARPLEDKPADQRDRTSDKNYLKAKFPDDFHPDGGETD